MPLGYVKSDQRKIWLTSITCCILIVQRVASYVIIDTHTKASLNGNAKLLSLVRQKALLRRNVSISSSTNGNNTVSNAEPTKNNNKQQRRMGELTKSEQVAYDILCELSKSEYSFRIVVVGKNGGAILESTVPCLGPKIKILQSPSTGTTFDFPYTFVLLTDYYCQSCIYRYSMLCI